MSTLDLAWISSQGAVRFTVGGVPNDGVTTVKRVTPGGVLQAIRGYPDGTWHGTSGLGYDYEAPMSVAVQYAIVNRDDTNLVPTVTTTVETNAATNPNLEAGALGPGWVAVSAPPFNVSLDTTAPIAGSYSAMTTRDASSPSSQVSAIIVSAYSAAYLPVTPGQPITVSCDVKTELAGRRVKAFLQYWNGTTNANGPTLTVAASTVAGAVQRITYTDTVPAGYTSARLRLTAETVDGSNAITGERIWFDNCRWGGSTYFDGSTPPSGSTTYAWTGTPNASSSTKTTVVTTWPTTAVIFTQTPGRTNGEAWLRDVLQPILSRPVSVVSTGDEAYTARQSILNVAGKSTPYVVWDSRSARQGTITLAVANKVVPGVWDDATDRLKLEALFTSGRPLLLSLCAGKGYANGYLAIDTVTFSRIGMRSAWLVTLDYVEVDNPTGLGVQVIPEVTYASAQQLPPSAKYSDWVPVDYFTIATRTSIPAP